MEEDKRKSLLFFIGLFAIIGLLALMIIWGRKSVGQQIERNTGYAIGTYQYMSGLPTKGGTYLFISFDAKNKRFENITIKGKLTSNTKALKGDLFLVIYDTLNPENCQILFDYPIKDSSDFIRYLEEFKTKPLDMSRYF
uniref:hypothetical protein n=1 Tax=uncultured Dysgonomonas sp. TaxID=206096 RepID=UPI002623DDA7|nr:hypothetical protein [uncultured Dysgonomonas sp.]